MFRKVISGSRLNSNINVTPMADVMLVLLIIFMITTPILQEDVHVNLPKAKYPNETPGKPVVLSLTREGTIYLGNRHVTEQEMVKSLSEHFSEEINNCIYIRADQALAYGNVKRIIDTCRELGLQRIGLMTDREIH